MTGAPRGQAGDIQLEAPVAKHPDVVPAVEDRSYVGFIAAALVMAIAGGFLLAVLLPLVQSGTIPGIERTPQLIQAHGWAQLQGWAGLFVAGMAMRLLPRFAGRQPIQRRVTVPILVLLVLSIAIRTVAEPFASGAWGESLVLFAAVIGALGTLAVSTVIGVTLIKGRRRRESWRYFAFAGAGWWAVWAAFIFGGALKSINNERYVPATLDDALTWIVIFGAIGNFVWTVQSRSVPVFYGRKNPRVEQVLLPGLMLNAGAALIAVSLLPMKDAAEQRLAGGGLLLAGLAFIVLPPIAGSVWGSAHRLRPRARSAARYVLGANIATMVAGALLIWAGAHSLQAGAFESFGARDAARHALGLGFITMLILGMARLVAPVFALERAEARGPVLIERLPFWFLIAAIVLRVLAGLLFSHMDNDARLHIAATAGVLGWLAIAMFAISVANAFRKEPKMKALLAEQAAAAAAAKKKR